MVDHYSWDLPEISVEDPCSVLVDVVHVREGRIEVPRRRKEQESRVGAIKERTHPPPFRPVVENPAKKGESPSNLANDLSHWARSPVS